MTKKTYNSAYDDMHERPETLGEAITFMIDAFRLVHKNARILAKENAELRKEIDNLKLNSLPAKTFGRVNRLERDFVNLRNTFDDHDTSGRHVIHHPKYANEEELCQ